MAYQLFETKSVKIGTPSVTVSGGKFSFNADAGDILHRVGAKFLHLFWDSEECRVAFRPLTKREDNAYKISFPQGKRGATVTAQSFLKHIRWKTTQPRSILITWNEKEKLMEAGLPRDQVGAIGKSRI
jgi:hypothetical protein